MKYFTIFIMYLSCCLGQSLEAQEVLVDTSSWSRLMHAVVDETVITASRVDRSLSNVTVPATIIPSQAIRKTGLLKLHELLQEQTGLLVTAGAGSSSIGGGIFGNGIQIQGLSPDYTLIMLDGEPIIGRQGGTLDLSRFALGNIQKIEVIKGPSSALYGSEAMGGVVNILTEQKRENQTMISARYGSFRTADLFGSTNRELGRSSLFLFGHFNRSDGYDLTPETRVKTIDPHDDYTAQLRWTYRFSDKTRLTWSNRFFSGKQRSFFSLENGTLDVQGEGKTMDININPVLSHRWNESFNSTIRFYGSKYRYDQSLIKNTGEYYYEDDFKQYYYRVEQQNDWDIRKNVTIVTGGGFNHQSVETRRYKARQNLQIGYLFAQLEYKIRDTWTFIPGFRYDVNSAYANRFSPKISMQYKVNKVSRLNLSYGSGFKAPDFRQLFLSYANPAAQGYRVYGAEEFSISTMEEELSRGTISKILPEAYRIGTLSPEISHGINVGYIHDLKQAGFRFDVNLFYNDVQNLINYLPVALQPNGTFVFSYKNSRRAFTTGLEGNVSGKWLKQFEWSMGYQFLFTGEQATLQNIRAQKLYGRDNPFGSAKLMTVSDYTGLLGRSPHMLNVKFGYTHPGTDWSGNIRTIYRSRWGVVDLDGNGFANMKEEFAVGFVQINLTLQKIFARNYTLQLAVHNVLDHRDEVNVPNMAGAHVMLSFSCKFFKSK